MRSRALYTPRPSSDRGLQPDPVKSDLLVTAHQLRRRECVPKSSGLRAAGRCMSVCCFLERPLLEVVYRAEALRAKAGLIFDNRQLEVERELQLIYEIGGERSPP